MSFHEPFEIHMKWKICFIGHIRRQRPLSAALMEKIVHESDCALERWLLSHDTLHLRDTAEYLLARHLHSRFHDEMRHLAYLINDRHFAEAEAFLQPSSSYERTSLLLARSLSALARISNETLIAAD